MRPIKIGGRRIICPICKRRYATAPVFGIVCCGGCLRGLFMGFMLGKNSALDEIYENYDIKKKEAPGND